MAMRHICKAPRKTKHKMYGVAIQECHNIGKKLFVHNDEYMTQVNYCPFCGFKAEEQIEGT